MTAMTQRLLRPTEMAEVLGVSIGTLANWRCRGMGPDYLKLGGSRNSLIRYLPEQHIEDIVGKEERAK